MNETERLSKLRHDLSNPLSALGLGAVLWWRW